MNSKCHRLNRILSILFILPLALDSQAQLSVASNETLKVTSADELVLTESLVNNGTIERISLSGTSALSVTGTGTMTHLKLNKSAGTASITGGMQSITGTLDLSSGTLAVGGTTTTAGFLTLKSNASGTARVLTHTGAGTGTVTGNVIVERFIPGSRRKQWRILGFPYSENIKLSRISGIGITYTGGPKTMMMFNESIDDGIYGNGTVRNAGYESFAADTDEIPAGKGVAAWLYGPDNNTPITGGDLSSALTISSFGQLNESGSDVVMTSPLITNNNLGWNLVSNPFASTIDWHAVLTASASGNLASTVYRWDPQAADWSAYNQSGGTTYNGSQYIESGAAFFITSSTKKTSGGGSITLTIPQTAKTGEASNNLHFTRAPLRLNMSGERIGVPSVKLAGIRVKASGQGNPIPGEAYLDVSRADATRGWDPKYDGMMMPRTSGASVFFDEEKEDDFSLHFDAPLSSGEQRYYPLTVTSPAPGPTMLELRSEGAWNPLNSVALIDTKEGKTLPMKGGTLAYSFQIPTIKETGRFLLAVNHLYPSKDGNIPASQLRILGNPVTGSRIDLILSHPTALPKRWEITGANGSRIGTGSFNLSDGNIQYAIQVPGMREPGVYNLQVELDNGEVQTVKVMRR